MLHLVGPHGYGKSDIANYAAKYALSGRVDLDGALYVDIEKKGFAPAVSSPSNEILNPGQIPSEPT